MATTTTIAPCSHFKKHTYTSKVLRTVKSLKWSSDLLLLCLKCGATFDSETAAAAHSARQKHPVYLESSRDKHEFRGFDVLCRLCSSSSSSCSTTISVASSRDDPADNAAEEEETKEEESPLTASNASPTHTTTSEEPRPEEPLTTFRRVEVAEDDVEELTELLQRVKFEKQAKQESAAKTIADSASTTKPTNGAKTVALSLPPTEEVRDPPNKITSKPPPGLRNLGNTCYFNSTMQMLNRTPFLCDRLTQLVSRSGSNANGTLVAGLSRCLSEMNGGKAGGAAVVAAMSEGGKNKGKKSMSTSTGSGYNPTKFFSQIQNTLSYFAGFHQHDAQEFLTFLLAALEEETKALMKGEAVPIASAAAGSEISNLKETAMKNVGFFFREEIVKGRKVRVMPRVEDDEEAAREEPEDDDGLAFGGGDSDSDSSSESDDEESETEANEERATITTAIAGEVVDPLETFRVILKSTVRCDECKVDAVTREPHFTITLCFPSAARPNILSHHGAANNNNSKGGKRKGGSKHGGGKGKRGKGDEEEEEEDEMPYMPAEPVAAGDRELRNLSDYLERFGRTERLLVANGEGFECARCAKRGIPHTDATKRLEIESTNDVVVFHMNRFQAVSVASGKGNKMRSAKVSDSVRLEEEVVLAGGEYRLAGVVEHLGSTMGSGHYVAHVRSSSSSSSTGGWFTCSDSSVSSTTLQKVLNAQCYMAFYERVVVDSE